MNEGMREGCQDIDLRCVCGKLLLKRTPTGFEVKCARCKRTVVLQDVEDGMEDPLVKNICGQRSEHPAPSQGKEGLA